jgi:hypothetical protein
MNVHARYLALLVACGVALAALYYAAFSLALAAPMQAEYWVRDAEILKGHFARSTPGRRLLIAGGSNALFGFDSTKLSDALSMPAINLAIHAGLPLDRNLTLVKSEARAGDTVILALEWLYYLRDYESPTDWTAIQVLSWDASYFRALGARRQAKLIASTSLRRVLEAWQAKLSAARLLAQHPSRSLRPPHAILADYDASARPRTFEYSGQNLDQRGDLQNTCSDRPSKPLQASEYTLDSIEIDPVALDYIKATVRELERRGARVFLVFPSMATELNKGDALLRPARHLVRALANEGLPFLGTLDDAMLPERAFFDTAYHLSCEGRRMRTERLIARLTSQR